MTSATGSTYLDGLISPSSTPTGAASSRSKGSTSLGQADFLKLLTTQMTTQDPTNPMDNTDMVAQMAQFSSVAGIAEMNQSLAAISSSLTSSRLGDTAGWIGKNALVESSVATPLSNGAYGGQLDLPSDATSVTLTFVDASGKVVHTEELGAQEAGSVSFAWDGTDSSGATVATGALSVSVAASGSSGTITPSLSTWNQITGIQSPASGSDMQLITALGLVSPDDVTSLA